MKKLLIVFGVLFHWLWKLLGIGRVLVTNLFFLIFLFLLIVPFFYQPTVHVPDSCALLLDPAGSIVEKKSFTNPLADFINDNTGVPVYEETALQDILDTINKATQDNRIKLMILSLDRLESVDLNQLQTIGHAIDQFKKTGKKVIAIGDKYSQSQYLLASHGDEVYLNPMGLVELRGFGIFRLYAKELLDKLDINFHVFRVGSYKSAIEPLTRNSMSPEAREANLLWLRHLWDLYKDEIRSQRNLKPGTITDLIENISDRLKAVQGDTAQLALDSGLVDGLKTHQQISDYLVQLAGRGDKESGYNQIRFKDYFSTLTPSYTQSTNGKSQIGIIIAQGNIVHGQGGPGMIGSKKLAQTISQARMDDNVKAVVLRINSGGGSAMASEIIRQQVKLIKESGKPVVVSMGFLAASGGYWISADANQIWASPVTLTGSIGIFGAIPTFEKSLSRIGITSDGVGTTPLSQGINPTHALSPEIGESIQQSIENGYARFIGIVAQGRSMSVESVKKIAEGHVWDGATAKQLGLVDNLGNLTDAISAAADLAGITDYDPVYISNPLTPQEKILQTLGMSSSGIKKPLYTLIKGYFPSQVSGLLLQLQKKLIVPLFNDPVGVYANSLLDRDLITF